MSSRRFPFCLTLLAGALALCATLPAAAITCTVTASQSPLNLGSYTVLAAATTTIDVTFTCTKSVNAERNVTWRVWLTTGSTTGAGGFAGRAMFNGATALPYNIYTTNAYAVVWGDTTGGTGQFTGTFTYTNGASGIGEVRTATMTGFAQVVANQDLDAGSYATTSAITIQARAGTTDFNTTTFNVNSTLSANCLIDTASTLAFGNYNPSSGADIDTSSSLTTRCTKTTPYTISLGQGGGASYAPRKMDSAGVNTDQLDYNLYTSAAYSSVWGDGTASTSTIGGSGAGILLAAAVNRSIFGRLFAGQDKTADTYSDTVTVTVTY